VLTLAVSAIAVAAIFVVKERPLDFEGEGTYTFMSHQPGDPGTPVRFSSCKPIRVELNLDGVEEPEVAKQMVLSAMGEMSAASGLQLHYVGPTKRRPRWPDQTLSVEGGAWPVLIAFADPDELPALEGNAGLGGGTSIERLGVQTYVTGTVALDLGYFNDVLSRSRGLEAGRATVMHELGHVLGLGHVKDDHELMNSEGGHLTQLGPGDRRGLALLGKGPCT
jgi:hypothetical protein